MKLLKKMKNNKTKIALLLLTALFISCSDYLDVDTDKDNPTIAPEALLLSQIEIDVAKVGDFDLYTGTILGVYTHQMTTRENVDQYGVRGDNFSMSNDWNNIYLTLTNIESLISLSTESGNLVYLGMAQMQKAYLMSVAVDLWGDVPFTEASKLTSGITSPKFDDQKEVYAAVFSLIETAKANITSNAGAAKPAGDDFYYNGNTGQWIKFINTFKLKLYNQVRLSSNFDQAGFDALVAENNFFTSIEDDFQFTHTSVLAPLDERNNLFIESYPSTQFSTYQSPWFYEILKGVNPNIHTNNADPRMKYYFFNQLTAGTLPPDQGNPATGNPRADYWDKSSGFFSIRFGSVGPDRDSSAENSYTYPGIFPAGGRYDDSLGAVITQASGTGIAPRRILTYDEFLYIQAELIQAGKLSGAGTAATKLEQAINASFAKVDDVVANNGSSQTGIPILTGSAAVTTFIGNVMAEYTAAATNKKLEIIMTQKWVATFGDPLDQYNDYRRTGFPILANPTGGPSPEYQLNNADGFPLIDSQTIQNNLFQTSFFWPQNELNANQNAPAQKNPTTYKIFWDN